MKWVKLGDYIEQCDERNSGNKLSEKDVKGISTAKMFIETKANLEGVSLSSYKLVNIEEFAFVPDTSRRGDKMSLAFNNLNKQCLVSSISCVFKIIDKEQLYPDYLYMWFCCSEFDRYARFNSWGSAREAFSYDEMCRVKIPLPSIEYQKEVVAAWKGLKNLKEQNEQLAQPLMDLCQSYLVELKKKYNLEEIGPYIHRIDIKNTDNCVEIVKSVSVTKELNDTNAKVDKTNLSSYKVVYPRQISFVQTTGNEKCLCAAMNTYQYPIVVTSVNEVFEADENKILPEYLMIIFKQKETDRYARFHSWGSARETFKWDDMCRFKIPLPPIEVQQAIVNIYNCAKEAKDIANKAEQLIKDICPALMRQVIGEN